MHLRKPLVPAVVTALFLNLLLATAPASIGAASGFTRQISSTGTTTMRSVPQGTSAAFEVPEFRGSPGEGEAADRSQSDPVAPSVTLTAGAKKAKSNPDLKLDFQGLNHRNQRLANGGNQFSLEPPDQGLCVGNGYVLETVNDVLRVYDTAGNAVTGVIDQNTFYGYPAAINRTTGAFGPFVTDPECIFDTATQRWFHTVLTLDVDAATGAFLGPNHIDIAVSQTADPTGTWNIWRLPVQNDGTDGTPNHHCSNPDAENEEGPCIGDYPHIGLDAYGFYITTNEYAFFGPEFKSANIYAISKSALVAGASTITVTQFETVGLDNGQPGFTLRPSMTTGTAFELGAGGTEYFMSSNAAEEASGNPSGTSDDLLVWALANTSSLATTPALSLSHTTLSVGTYSVPPKANQKAGDFPLGQCINDTTISTPFGLGCWQFFFVEEPAHDEVISTPDSGDSRMMQVTFANGKLWGALDTGLELGGDTQAGIEWFIVKPTTSASGVSAVVQKSGYLGLEDNNLTYPAIGVTNSGRGAMVFTVLGDDHYPSAAFAPIDAQAGVGDITVFEAGAGPTDGFTSYKAFVGDPPRTRWGDYSAAATDGNAIWLGTEYIASTCNLATYVSGGFSCGQTRTSLGNWSTRVAKVVP
jgi:hypothetical protein